MTTNSSSLSITELFDAGSYTTVAMTGSQDQWQTYAAMGLVGKSREAVEGLRRFDCQEARFYSAVASWIDGDEATAIATLQEIRTPYGQNLLALIRKPEILILAQLPWTRLAPHDLLTAAAKDKKFKIQNISFHPEDLPNKPYADIGKFYDSRTPPDFYVCAMVEWHVIPPNLQKLPCPLFGHTADYDSHIQTVYPWLQIFDELVVTDQTEWEDVSRLVRFPVSTFPKPVGVAANLPPIPKGPREIDVFLSGSTTHPYWYEKIKLLHQILRMPDVTALAIEGFVLPETYHMLLGQSKVTFSYIRHSGAMPTRALEALSMGCAAVVQKGSAITLYLGEEQGVWTYDFKDGNLAETIRKIVSCWPDYEHAVKRGAEIVRKEFALPRVASQYLRYLTFLAAKPRDKRPIQQVKPLVQKRSVLRKGLLPGGIPVLQELLKENIPRWSERLKSKATPHLFIDMARDLLLDYATVVSFDNSSPARDRRLAEILSLYKSGLRRFPKSLVLRFNLIRAAVHAGCPRDVSEALKLTEDTLHLPASSWHLDVMEDVFPYDFASSFFNYRKYLDLATESLTGGKSVTPALIQLILASLHYYLGLYTQNPSHLQKAMILDPDFPVFKLEYARQLVRRAGPGDYEEAGALLTQLAEGSSLFVEAFEFLKKLETHGLYRNQRFAEVGRLVNRFHHSSLNIS
ncbi:MAG: hypothetical protein AMJ94_06960 [Deltaproteobacteria bacterium SM23_61]|nr:MAG: hypothetical protein AMJ94_06960 [Deltaproteobacteria bacterium SM23_61]